MKPVHTFPRIATDETLRETVSHGSPDYPFQYYLENVWEFDLHCIDWHWHPELEMIYVNSGETLVSIGGEQVPVPEGCGMLINGRMVHRFQSKRSTWMPNIVFSPALLAPEGSLIYRRYVQPLLEHSGFEPLTPTRPVGLLQSQHPFTTAANAGIARVCEKHVFLSFTPKSAVFHPVLWSENWSDLH